MWGARASRRRRSSGTPRWTRPTRRCRGRWTATSTTSASPTWRRPGWRRPRPPTARAWPPTPSTSSTGHSTQAGHSIIQRYDYAGQPGKAQAKVREALSRLYLGSEIGQGYTGDEDNGEMSAWYVFSALGFYPLQMGSPYYAIGSPLFRKATVNLENGKKIVVNAPDNSRDNVYVQGLKVNGQAYDKTYLPHDVLAKGAVLDFAMGPQPSRWGTGLANAPLSITQGNAAPQPLRDITKPDGGK